MLSQDIKKAFILAYEENSWFIDNAEITISDNYDSQSKNIEELLQYLEKNEIPIIINLSYSERNQQFYNILENSGKTIITSSIENIGVKNILPVIPSNPELFNQAFTTLPDYIYTQDILLVADYATLQIEKVSTLCKSKNVVCEQIDDYEKDWKSTFTKKSLSILLISEKQLILNWLSNNHPNSNTPIIVFETAFANPSEFKDQSNSLYWIGPDVWFNKENKLSSKLESSNNNWEFAQSFIAYNIFRDVFRVVESHLSDTKNGFRHLYPDLLISQLKNSLIEPTYKFHIYQLQNSRFIISEPIP